VTFGGCTDNSTSANKLACYSNGGPLVDFYAPGHQTRTSQAGGGFDNNFGGTSASAAYVAGVAAQIMGLLPGATAAEVANALKTTGVNITDTRSGSSIVRKRIDGLAAYQLLADDNGAPTPTPTSTPTQPGPTPTPTKTPTGGGPGPTATPTKTPTLAPGGAPAPPSSLVAQAVSHTAVLLQWNDNSNNETGFAIERRTGGGSFQEVAVAPAGATFFAVEELSSSTAYDFRVRARNASGTSTPSNVASATTAASTPPCVRDANTACLLGSKFRITGEMKNFQNAVFPLQVMDFPGGRAESNQASFWQSFQIGNFEIAIKMQNACSLPQGHPLRFFWLFFGGLTDQRTDMTIRDTVTGQTIVVTNPANTFPTTIANTAAFPCVNLGGATNCTANDTTACLLDGRFKVTGSMRNAQQQEFITNVMHFVNAASLQPRNRAETDQAAFFQSFEPGNFEVGVKMLDACTLPQGHPLRFYWIFYGGLTNAFTEVRAVHTTTGRVDIWRNPALTLPTTEGRTMAFPCP